MSDDGWIGPVPRGRMLEPDKADNVVGEINFEFAATAERVQLCRERFLEVDADDFTRKGRIWTDRGSGKQYRRCLHDPFAAGPSGRADDDRLLFFISADQRVVLLRPRGEEPAKRVPIWALSSVPR